MLKTLRIRRFLGAIAAILGVAALAFAADPPPGACKLEDAGWATADGGCKDLTAGLVWSSNVLDNNGYQVTWDYAKSWCDAKVEGGYSDWRLPTVAEITAAAAHNAAAHLNSKYLHIWTSQTRGNKAYNGNLANGISDLWPKNSTTGQMCVRP